MTQSDGYLQTQLTWAQWAGAEFISPFLKWVGGKTKLLNIIRDMLPSDLGNVYDPFLGGDLNRKKEIAVEIRYAHNILLRRSLNIL